EPFARPESRRLPLRLSRHPARGARADSVRAQLGRLRLRQPVPGAGGAPGLPPRRHPGALPLFRGVVEHQLSPQCRLRTGHARDARALLARSAADLALAAVRREGLTVAITWEVPRSSPAPRAGRGSRRRSPVSPGPPTPD